MELSIIPPDYVLFIAYWLYDATDYLNLSQTCSRFRQILSGHQLPMRVSNHERRRLHYMSGVTKWNVGTKHIGHLSILPTMITELTLLVRTKKTVSSTKLIAFVNLRKLVCPQLRVDDAAMGCDAALEELECAWMSSWRVVDDRKFPALKKLTVHEETVSNSLTMPREIFGKIGAYNNQHRRIEMLMSYCFSWHEKPLLGVLEQFTWVRLADFIYVKGFLVVTKLKHWIIMESDAPTPQRLRLTCLGLEGGFIPVSTMAKESKLVFAWYVAECKKQYQPHYGPVDIPFVADAVNQIIRALGA